MRILLHSSKAMRAPRPSARPLTRPALLDRAAELIGHLRAMSTADIASVMGVSQPLAERTHDLHRQWRPDGGGAAVDSFVGDIYSGLQVTELSDADREHAADRLRILSGLYGILRPDDGICPYRLEMGYRIGTGSLYDFWGDSIVGQLPADGPIVDLTATEYGQTVTRFVSPSRLVAPRFLTVSPRTGKPTFVTVHAKIARGAFARWLITSRVDSTDAMHGFAEIGYSFDRALSTPAAPAFVCREFGGRGLSVRLKH
ncbi:YaaA family protein [Pilimelia columellifera]|uniref:UPF0246 protein GCM10010201_07340 n=1 Tax=Pilimelia columellifera subsp. columellifera TaxID=706583 RepID=A0ABP6ABS9_9ACTN